MPSKMMYSPRLFLPLGFILGISFFKNVYIYGYHLCKDGVMMMKVNDGMKGRRSFVSTAGTAAASAFFLIGGFAPTSTAALVGPVKIPLAVTAYESQPCPKDKPMPGEKAMKDMRPMCVQVRATLESVPPKNLEKVGVYGFVTDAETGDSVLANNPDLSTDAGQFAMIEQITTNDSQVKFEFVAAIPMEKDVSNGIGSLQFDSLRIISYPGGQQFGAISPCEMNEFSVECEEWEEVNGPYSKGKFMMKSNARTKGY